MADLDWLFRTPIAHRGLHDGATRMENTLAAAAAAVASGFGIECDVQLSADGEAMVFHDFDLDRLTAETGPLASRTAAALGRLTIGRTGETIPTLPAFLDAIGGAVPLIIEVKSRHDGDFRLVRRVVEILAERSDPIVIKSFDPDVIAELRRIAPTLPRGIVTQSSYAGAELAELGPERARQMTELLHFDATRPDFLSWRHADLPDAAPHLARLLAGTPVMAWTVRSQETATRVAPFADQIVFEGFLPASPATADQAAA